jgi:hypothetical protein
MYRIIAKINNRRARELIFGYFYARSRYCFSCAGLSRMVE